MGEVIVFPGARRPASHPAPLQNHGRRFLAVVPWRVKGQFVGYAVTVRCNGVLTCNKLFTVPPNSSAWADKDAYLKACVYRRELLDHYADAATLVEDMIRK